jgi:mannose-6-phosphate isomerase-like protein (cupin superfamily)
MKKINVQDIRWVERRSPKGRFHKFLRDVAQAFENPKTGPRLPAQPPFEVELVRLPPGATNFPFHSHLTEWEFYLIVEGTGEIRAGKVRRPLRPGDCVLNPPGEPHHIRNTGQDNLLYYVIANNAPFDVWHYPDSDKWGGTSFRTYFRMAKTDYYDREE